MTDPVKNDKILIIECEQNIRETLAALLSPAYALDVVPSLQNGLELIRDRIYSVIVTGIDTPEIKGIEVVRKLKELKSDIPVIVVATYQSVPLAVEAMKAGAYDYITNPFNPDELMMVIQHALERQKLLEEVKEKKIFQELALLDGLTKIYNRRYFDELLRQEIGRSSRYLQFFSLLMIDVDNFKHFNDCYGHPAGDEILKELADILNVKTRITDFAARYGGDEFAIIAPHTNRPGALLLATRLSDVISQRDFIIAGKIIAKIRVSIGLATFGEDTNDKDELIRRADAALYQAKRLGKNRVCLFCCEEMNNRP
ncbi:MAG: diguanylate cyclase [Elusimicrobia bacterium]|nr:diguanylate cyclase [Elusimicrobiota bacterium]